MLEEFLFGVKAGGAQLRRGEAQRRRRRPVTGVDRRAGGLRGARRHVDHPRRGRRGRPGRAADAREARARCWRCCVRRTPTEGIALAGADGGVRRARPLRRDPHARTTAVVEEFGTRVKAVRIIANAPSSLGGIGDIYNAFIPSLTLGLRLVRPQLRVEQRLRGEPAQHQADRPAQQQPAVVQGAGEDLLRAERDPLPRGHARRAPRDDRDRRDHDAAGLRRQASSTCWAGAPSGWRCRSSTTCEPEPTVQTVQTGAARMRAVPARHDHRARRRLADGRRQGDVAALRAPRGRLRRHEGEVLRRPQARVHLPGAGRAGAARVHPDDLGHRRGGDAVRGDHRPDRPARSTRWPTTRSPRRWRSSTRC